MPGRQYTSSGGEYRFGFQGQEKNSDLSGVDGGHLDFKYRIHDARLGRFLSVDPLSASYPWNSTYAFAENKLGMGIELEGAELLPFGSSMYRERFTGYRLSVEIVTSNVPIETLTAHGIINHHLDGGVGMEKKVLLLMLGH